MGLGSEVFGLIKSGNFFCPEHEKLTVKNDNLTSFWAMVSAPKNWVPIIQPFNFPNNQVNLSYSGILKPRITVARSHADFLALERQTVHAVFNADFVESHLGN